MRCEEERGAGRVGGRAAGRLTDCSAPPVLSLSASFGWIPASFGFFAGTPCPAAVVTDPSSNLRATCTIFQLTAGVIVGPRVPALTATLSTLQLSTLQHLSFIVI